MSTAAELYQQWLREPSLDEGLRKQLEELHDEQEIEDRFFRDLEFGTGGLRGVLGAGTNRMNIYTVRKATLGLARYLKSQGLNVAAKGVVIGYDCRHMSPEFSEDISLVLAAEGIPAYVFEHLCPTPELSFAVRSLNAAAGIMVTASHNPPEYNGYKVYGPDGGQVLPDEANRITSEIEQIENLFSISVMARKDAESAGYLRWIGTDVDSEYIETVVAEVKQKSVSPHDRDETRLVYTPLHGTGNLPVREALRQAGYKDVYVVRSQEKPDGNFSTVESPNPEEPEALRLAIEEAKKCGADVVMGTDPDADRVGVAVGDQDGSFRLLTGNQVGGLLVEFVLKSRIESGGLPTNGIVFKTIVTSELGAQVARLYNVAVEDTLTGFKYIGNRISAYERTGEYEFLFGYEESYGYLASSMVRDKDAVQIALLIAEMTAYYKSKGQTLLDALETLYERVGYFREDLVSRKMPGLNGMKKIQNILNGLRQHGIEVPGLTLDAVEDYQTSERREVGTATISELSLPKENVLKYFFSNGSWLAVRPSGTEPKIKVYIGAKGNSLADCQASMQILHEAVDTLLQ
ncbi:phospho-sugar mutase [Alicyclobacillus sp. SO9]|uniref:phospho-sugar mutase n=1 Tax=Alicyclobacillus sp. SO9 TaxID=2665646 RepID=UPI0018E83E77|nr:phospho-sugar mutase [Alicyclobacillus sp. SO9]QQE78136.1 phospho-sugar mutase [Alicyclobacillus sp. SO9]